MANDWSFPAPRPGLAGALDRFIGPGARRVEAALHLVSSLLVALVAPLYAPRLVAKLKKKDVELMGQIQSYENVYKLCYVRGREGIILELAEQIK